MISTAQLTVEDLAALRSYAEEHGKKWKDALTLDWFYSSRRISKAHARAVGERGAILHGLRNNWGPSQLAKFTFPPVTYRMGSGPMISAPGIVAWAVSGYRFPKDRKAMLKVIVAGWGIPTDAAKALLSGKAPYTVEDDVVVVFTA